MRIFSSISFLLKENFSSISSLLETLTFTLLSTSANNLARNYSKWRLCHLCSKVNLIQTPGGRLWHLDPLALQGGADESLAFSLRSCSNFTQLLANKCFSWALELEMQRKMDNCKMAVISLRNSTLQLFLPTVYIIVLKFAGKMYGMTISWWIC